MISCTVLRARAAALQLAAVVLLVCGCSSQQRLTAKATPCNTKEVQVLSSEFSRNGSTTAWCAECRGQLYQCATNTERTRVECHPARPDGVCK